MPPGGTAPAATILGPVLRSKVQIPPRSVLAIDRRRAFEVIDGGLAAGATVVVAAGPGFAKSTTVASWARTRRDGRVAWLSVDSRDNSPSRLLLAVVESIRQVEPGFGDEVVASIMLAPADVLDHAGPRLMAEIERLREPLVFVLDGADKLGAGRIRALLGDSIRTPPPGVQVVVTTRSDAAVDLVMLQAEANVCVVGETELAFDRDEIAALHQALREEPAADDVLDRLLDDTAGWPVGVVLALRSTAAVPRFSSRDHLVRAYLHRTVLDPLDDDLVAAFLTVNLFDRTCGAMCESLLGSSVADRPLTALRDLHLLPPVDRDDDWFEPFGTWRDFATDEYERRFSGQLDGTLARAAAWAEANGVPDEAVDLWLRVGNEQRAAEVLLRWHLLWSSTGSGGAVLHWCESLRASTPDVPELLLVEAWAHTLGHRVDRAMAALAALEHLPVADSVRQTLIECEAIAIRVSLRRKAGRLVDTRALAEAMAERLPDAGDEWAYRGRVPHDVPADLAVTTLYAGEVPAAVETLAELRPTTRNSVMGLLVASHLALANWLLADPDVGEVELLRRRLEEMRVPTFIDGVGHAMVSLVAPVPSVERHRRRLATIVEAVPEPALQVLHFLVEARIAATDGRVDDAAALVSEARAEAAACPQPGVLPTMIDRLVALTGIVESGDDVHITDAELRVLRALAGPLTEREIARELGLAHNTVRSHRRRIYRKLGVDGRSEAVDAARSSGWLG